MSTIFSCVPTWAGFADPTKGDEAMIGLFKSKVNAWIERVQEDGHPYEFHASGFEKEDKQLLRILRRNGDDVDTAFQEWVEWMKWRADLEANEIKEEEFKAHLTPLGIADWRGKDKEGRPALVLTGRLLTDKFRYKSVRLFRRYAIHMAEKGVHSLNEQGLEHACVLYDRRMLDFHHCDPELHNGCKHLLTAIRRFYGDRLGPVYILHMNWLFFGVFSYILKPFLTLFQNTDSMKMHAVQTPEELHEWFDEEHLLLDETHLEEEDHEPYVYDTEELVMDEAYDIRTEGVKLQGGTILTGLPMESKSSSRPLQAVPAAIGSLHSNTA